MKFREGMIVAFKREEGYSGPYSGWFQYAIRTNAFAVIESIHTNYIMSRLVRYDSDLIAMKNGNPRIRSGIGEVYPVPLYQEV